MDNYFRKTTKSGEILSVLIGYKNDRKKQKVAVVNHQGPAVEVKAGEWHRKQIYASIMTIEEAREYWKKVM